MLLRDFKALKIATGKMMLGLVALANRTATNVLLDGLLKAGNKKTPLDQC